MNLPIKTTAWMRPANLIHKAALLGALALAPIYGKAQTTAEQPSNIHNVILVHGAWADGSSWDKVIPLLEEKGFHVTAVHLPFTTLAEDAAPVERALALQDGPVLLVGHSYGAPVALLAALRFTNEVAGVVLIGGSVDPAQERTYAIQRFADWPLVSWLVPRSLRQCNRELLTLRGDLIRLRPQLSALEVPVVMLQGGKDRQVPVANVDYLRDRFADAGKTNLFDQLVFPDYNHFIPWKHPEAVEAAIRRVTDRLSRAAQNQ